MVPWLQKGPACLSSISPLSYSTRLRAAALRSQRRIRCASPNARKQLQPQALPLLSQAVVSASSTEISWNRDPIGGQVRFLARLKMRDILTVNIHRLSVTPLPSPSPPAPSSQYPPLPLRTPPSTLLPLQPLRRQNLLLLLLLSKLALALLLLPRRQ